MNIKLKRIDQQVILITGASSGIGLLTAQTAASLGAKVILIARNEEALDNAAADIVNAGGEAIAVAADVGDEAAFRAAVEKGVARFGQIDTWVNNAGTGMYGRLTETDLADDRKLFDTNFWGIVHGSRLAVEHLRSNGGALINVGSVVSDVSIPPQGMYSASKHAVLGFTDALRIEIEHDQLPISVTLIKPAAIDTPFPDHARNYYDTAASLPPPVYDPAIVASAILFAATHPRRELHAGGGGRLMSMFQREMPSVMDWILSSKAMWAKNFADRPAEHPEGALHHTAEAGNVHGSASRDRMVRKHSAYNTVAQHPIVSGAVVTAAVAAVATYLLLDHSKSSSTWGGRLRQYGENLTDRAGNNWASGISEVSKQAKQLSRQVSRHANDLAQQASNWWR
jgi:short-subunit dehydrogenase